MEQVKVLMNDGLEYVGYISSVDGCITIYTDEQDDAMFLGRFELSGSEVWAVGFKGRGRSRVGVLIKEWRGVL